MEIRVDKSEIPKVERTQEGYLRGEAIVTRTGVFRYLNADGTERMELRHPDDVFEEASLKSLYSIPITIDHPANLVTAETAAELSVGMTGSTHRVDRENIYTPLTITHKPGIDAVDAGKKELSLGYSLDLVPDTGSYNGIEYTHRQKNIRYNHLAIVARGRAGAQARLNLDGAAIQTPKNTGVNMQKVNVDGIQYDAAPEVAKALERAAERADKAEKENEDAKKSYDAMKKEYDTAKAKADELKAELEKMKEDRGDAAISEAAKKRVALLTTASAVVAMDSLVDKTDREIMESVITARHDGLDLSGKSDDYVAARFDAVVESVKTDGVKDQAKKVGPARSENKDAKPVSGLDIIRDQWKGENK